MDQIELTDEKLAKRAREYIDGEGLRCPFCGSEHIGGGSVDIDGREATQHMSCADCGRAWTDVHRRVGVWLGNCYFEPGKIEPEGELAAAFSLLLENAQVDIEGLRKAEDGAELMAKLDRACEVLLPVLAQLEFNAAADVGR